MWPLAILVVMSLGLRSTYATLVGIKQSQYNVVLCGNNATLFGMSLGTMVLSYVATMPQLFALS